MKACYEHCCCCVCNQRWSHKIKYPHLLYPGQGCLFSLMSRVSFIVSPPTIHCADGAWSLSPGCLFVQHEKRGFGLRSLPEFILWLGKMSAALYHGPQLSQYIALLQHSKMQRVTPKRHSSCGLFVIFLWFFFPRTQLLPCYTEYRH